MISMTMKDGFFDRQAVIKAVARSEHRAMSRGLSFIRQTQIRSVLHRRKRVSRPGQAPSIRSRDPNATLRKVFFAYDQRTSSGVVGPVRLNGRRRSTIGSQTVPGLLEEGGSMRITESRWKSSRTGQREWQRSLGKRRSDRREYRKRTVRAKPRPSISTALKIEIDKGSIPAAWSNVVTG